MARERRLLNLKLAGALGVRPLHVQEFKTQLSIVTKRPNSRQCSVCGAWFMSTAQCQNHMDKRHRPVPPEEGK